MRVRPFGTIAKSETEASKDLPDLSKKPLSELVALVIEHDRRFAGKSEEAVFIAACGDEENGLRNHKRYRIFPENTAGVRAFCIARLNRVVRELLASAPA